MKKFWLVLIFILGASLLQAETAIIGYFDEKALLRPASGGRAPFTLDKIDTSLFSELIYAFVLFTKNEAGEFIFDEKKAEGLKKFSAIQNVFLKLNFSIGGWGFNDPNDPEGIGGKSYRYFSEIVKEKRKPFIRELIRFAKKFDFDGVDIDWEYPGDLTRGGSEEDFENFLLFLKECKEAFNQEEKKLLLSMAAPATVPSGIPKKYRDDPALYFKWLKECSLYLDKVILMGYDYHVPFGGATMTGVNAPLLRDIDERSSLFIARSIENYLNAGIDKRKIVLAVPLYGHSFANVQGLSNQNFIPPQKFHGEGRGAFNKDKGFLAYFEISDLVVSQEFTRKAEVKTSTALAFNKSEWISFDTPETIALKAKLAKEKGLLGVAFWSIDQDEYMWPPTFPNVKAARGEIK